MPFFVSWETGNGTRKVSLKKWEELNHLVNVLKIKVFQIEMFEYTVNTK